MAAGQPAKLAVHDRREAIERVSIAAPSGAEQHGH